MSTGRADAACPDPPRFDETALVARIPSGDDRAFETLVRAYTVPLVQFAPPANVKPALASSLLTEDSIAADSAQRAQERVDSLERIYSLAKWVKEPLPTQLWLAPHQTVHLTLHLQAPERLAPGEYSAHLLVAAMRVVPLPAMSIPLPKGVGIGGGEGAQAAVWKPVMIFATPEMYYPRASVKLVYRAESTTH